MNLLSAKRRAGVVAPLFSVYSKSSLGIGELADLKLLIDWCSNTGQSVIQLLPLNEVSGVYCPYDSISSFALEPAYISLRLLPCVSKSIAEKIRPIKERFPAGKPYVDYGIKQEKLSLLREIFLSEALSASAEFRKFSQDSAYWLLDFALYKVLKDINYGKPWYEWEDKYKNRDNKELKILCAVYAKEIDFEMWVQWQLFRQFKEVKEYAAAKNVFMKGDLPILVSRDSADVWQHPGFFKLQYAAGAPPDMYCAKGQRWGMPTYNWQNIAGDSYKYLKEKLKYAENFYDILRIDHMVGLFRIWSIPFEEPLENKGLNGVFDPADESVWKEHGENILSVIIANTKMFLCAEDLGMIPKVCPDTLRELGIPGNDVQRWVKDWSVRHDFLKPQEYRTLSVAMLSTHDTTNWPAWWENEAGTLDEALFIRKCNEKKIDYASVKDKLFDTRLSRHSRLRWLNSVACEETLARILGKKKEEAGDLIDMYKNTYQEKEKLWKHLGLRGKMREKCDREIMTGALKITLGSSAVFCIESIIDWLFLAGVFKGDPYQYRINFPGTVSEKNWSLTIPISLEGLLKHKVNRKIKELIASSGRNP